MKYNMFPILLATTFLSTNAIAQTVPEINADYLNSLTGEKVTWEEVTTSGEDTVQIGNKYYKYTYHKPSTYTETSTRINDTLASADVTDILFRGISSTANGGAIYNTQNNSSVNIKADFIGNSTSASNIYGGAIYNSGIIGNIIGDFIGNYFESLIGAIYNDGIIGNIAGMFINNSSREGAISNWGTIDSIEGIFIGNASHYYNYAAITNRDTINSISADFIGNKGDAIWVDFDSVTNLISKNTVHIMSENMHEDSYKRYNAIFINDSRSTFNIKTDKNGAWVINDDIRGDGRSSNSTATSKVPYIISFIGDDTIDTELGTTTQYINMNNAIINAGEVKVENTTLRFGNYQHEDKTAKNWDGKGKFIASLNSDGSENLEADSVTSLTLNNAVFDISNGYLEIVKLKKYSATDSFVHLDVDVDNMKSDVINVKGDVDGVTKLVIHATSDKDIRGKGKILFAESFGDTLGNENSFEVARVYKSPYLYDVIYEGVENTSTPTESKDNTWFFEMNDEENPNKDKTPTQPLGPIEVAPEVIGFEAVTSAGLSQTNGMVYNIMRKAGVNRLFCPGCGFYDYNWDGKAFHNAWVDTTYNGLTIEAPVEIDANVWGIEAGSDIQHDLNNKLGIFASYRQGNYEMNGKGEKYYSTIGSELDIDSYLAGLYYRYDHNNWYAFATVYGGMQEAEIKTDDGISADTDGLELGGSIEGGYSYALSRTLSVTPSLGVFYSQINYDDATDSAGKTVEYNDLKQVELEAGAKFAHTQYTDDGFYSLYVKPSVVQTLVDGDEIDVTELGKVDTVEDKTLGRIEIGGNYGFNDNWSAYGWANYTFGSSYDATSLGVGISYSW